jgi:hypothetical protein
MSQRRALEQELLDMPFLSPAQVFSTTLYDRHQPQQQLSFVFVPTHSTKDGNVPDLNVIQNLIEPNASVFSIPPTYLPAALASMLANPQVPNPFTSVISASQTLGHLWVEPNSFGFAEYIAYSEVVPFEESPLRSKSLMTLAVATGAKIGLIAGAGTPLVLLTVPAGIVLCTAGVVFGPALGEKVSKLIGA